MGDAKPKYLNSPETVVFDKSRNLYGLHRARASRKSYFLLCEGYMDVISLHQAGFTNAVASLGTALTPGHASLIKRYVKEVYLTYDSDEAGDQGGPAAAPILRAAGITARVIRMDPTRTRMNLSRTWGRRPLRSGYRAPGTASCLTWKCWRKITTWPVRRERPAS